MDASIVTTSDTVKTKETGGFVGEVEKEFGKKVANWLWARAEANLPELAKSVSEWVEKQLASKQATPNEQD
jgi:hypothetical protein